MPLNFCSIRHLAYLTCRMISFLCHTSRVHVTYCEEIVSLLKHLHLISELYAGRVYKELQKVASKARWKSLRNTFTSHSMSMQRDDLFKVLWHCFRKMSFNTSSNRIQLGWQTNQTHKSHGKSCRQGTCTCKWTKDVLPKELNELSFILVITTNCHATNKEIHILWNTFESG